MKITCDDVCCLLIDQQRHAVGGNVVTRNKKYILSVWLLAAVNSFLLKVLELLREESQLKK